jgi:hypothetical protein
VTINKLVPVERIESRILLIRSQKVMMDSDLAEIYGVPTKTLNQAVKRNIERFPEDFMFQLSEKEFDILRSQFVTAKFAKRRSFPFVFTEHGAIMLASVINTTTAIYASIQVVRVFIRLRGILATNKELARKLDAMEKKYDKQFAVVFEAIRKLMSPPDKETKRIGF